MARLKCLCGNELSNSTCPSDTNGWLITDKVLEDADEQEVDVIGKGIDVWECDECGRLGFGNHKDNSIKWYASEDGEYAGICL